MEARRQAGVEGRGQIGVEGRGQMGMRAGDAVEDFEADDHTGTLVRLSDLLASGPVVVYFYPKAMTPG